MGVTITVSTVIVAAIGGFMLLLPHLGQRSVVFGLHVPTSHVDVPVVRAARRRYAAALILSLFVVMVLLASSVTVMPRWAVLVAAVTVPWMVYPAAYLPARRMVLSAREAENWYKRSLADRPYHALLPPLPWRWAVLPLAVATATLAVGLVIYPSLSDQITVHITVGGRDEVMTTAPQDGFGLVVIQIVATAWAAWEGWLCLRGEDRFEPPVPVAAREPDRRFWLAVARYSLLAVACVNGTLFLIALMMWGVLEVSTLWLTACLLLVGVGLGALVVALGRAG